MFPIFLWVNKYKCLNNFSVTLDENYKIDLNISEKDEIKFTGLTISKKRERIAKSNFYGENIDSIKAIVGKNGVGKTGILELLGLYTEVNRIFKLENPMFLIIYKTHDPNRFILEGHTKDDCFEFLKDRSKNSYINNYFCFEMKKENKFIGFLKMDKENKGIKHLENTNEFGVIRLSSNLDLNSAEQRMVHKESEYQKNKIYKLNLNPKYTAKSKVFKYIKLRQKKDIQNYQDFKFIIKIMERTGYLKKIAKKYRKIDKEYNPFKISELNIFKEEDIENKDIFSNEKNQKIKDTILEQYCNNLYYFEIYEKIENLSKEDDVDERIKEIKAKYNKLEKKELLTELLKNIEEIEYTKELNTYILRLINLTQELEENKILRKLREFEYEISYSQIKNEENEKKILDFLELYDELITYEWKTKLEISEIAKTIEVKESGMSDGEEARLNQFVTLFRGIEGELNEKKYITILLDEVETSLHPEWCRTLLNDYLNELKETYPEKEFKLVFATHTPFLMSDLLSDDIIYLDKKDNKSFINLDEDLKTFGGNIHNLFKENMFMNSTFGEFSKSKLSELIKDINGTKKITELQKLSENFLINEIAEPIIKTRIETMISEKREELMESKDYYEYKIEEYKEKIKNLKKK